MAAKRKTGAVLKDSTPGRFLIQLSYYDPKARTYKPVPGLRTYADVETPAEVRRLHALLAVTVGDEKWRDDVDTGGTRDAEPAGAGRAVARS